MHRSCISLAKKMTTMINLVKRTKKIKMIKITKMIKIIKMIKMNMIKSKVVGGGTLGWPSIAPSRQQPAPVTVVSST